MLKLLRSNIAVVPVGTPDMTESGLLHIPDIAKKRATQGVVKYIGEGVKEVQVGDYVIFSGYTGTSVRLSGGEGVVVILHEDFVTAILALSENIVVPGLYFYSGNGEYHQATYEMIMPLAARALEEFGSSLKIKTPNPKVEEYNRK